MSELRVVALVDLFLWVQKCEFKQAKSTESAATGASTHTQTHTRTSSTDTRTTTQSAHTDTRALDAHKRAPPPPPPPAPVSAYAQKDRQDFEAAVAAYPPLLREKYLRYYDVSPDYGWESV